MKTVINMTVYHYDMDRFKDKEDLRSFYKKYDIDGLELQILWQEPLPDKIPVEDVIGIHTRMFPSWLDLWRGDFETLNKEFVSQKNWEMYYEGTESRCMLKRLRGELNRAKELGAEYVVFHISDVRYSEIYSRKCIHSDEEVIDASCEFINELLDSADYDFWFLMENLWWPGLRMTDPKMTKRLIDGIHYEKKGIMLDTGHLMHTNWNLKTEEEGIAYIEQMLDNHGKLCDYIKGFHFHQSITGEFVQKTAENPPPRKEDFWEQMNEFMYYFCDADQHLPFTSPKANHLIERICPEYLNLEYLSIDRKEHEAKLAAFRPAPLPN